MCFHQWGCKYNWTTGRVMKAPPLVYSWCPFSWGCRKDINLLHLCRGLGQSHTCVLVFSNRWHKLPSHSEYLAGPWHLKSLYRVSCSQSVNLTCSGVTIVFIPTIQDCRKDFKRTHVRPPVQMWMRPVRKSGLTASVCTSVCSVWELGDPLEFQQAPH